MKIKYFGHSNFLISSDCNIIIDPFFTGNPFVDENEKDNVKPDIIIVTHAHADHVGDTEYIAKKTNAIIISNFEICNYFEKKGLKTHALHIGGKKTFPWGFIKLTPAFHGSSFADGSYGGSPAGVIVNIEGKSVYHAGDTGLSYEMKMLGETNDIYVAMLPVGDNFTMGIEDAVKAAEWLRAKIVIPMHYNTFDLIKVNVEEFEYAFRHFRLEYMKSKEETTL
ncbi:MAG: metal-dependent hydrolase [Candidatus Muirbacterium halophilum]|nr:metal-dependent hydrolase [Candidatus Muirbacterium halophilum]